LTVRVGRETRADVVREARAAYGPEPGRSRRLPVIDADVEHHLKRAGRAEAFVVEGRHAAAERLLRDVAAALARRGRAVLAGQMMLRLGRTILERGRSVDAERVFGEAASAAASVPDTALMTDARLWQAAARTDAARLTDAEAICRALIAAGALDGGRLAWARAALARVLMWQGRLPEARDLDLTLPADHDLDEVTMLFVRATEVRVLVASARLFEAGVRAGRLVADAGKLNTMARAIASTAHLRFLVAAGALEPASTALRQVVLLAKEARLPLRGVRARAIWAAGLARDAGGDETRRAIAHLRRWHKAAPVLLRRAIDSVTREAPSGGRDVVSGDSRGPAPDGVPAIAMIAAAQDAEDDREAVLRVIEVASRALGTSRIDLCSADAGPVSAILSRGAGLPTRLGSRVLDTGLTLGPEPVEAGHEIGVVVRRGGQLVAAIVARWPADRQVPSGSRSLLDMASAVAAPHIGSMIAAARVTARSATAVPELVGVSDAIDEVRGAITRAAAVPFPVLIVGESGVGKELAARAIHQLGPRRERRFCDVNCAALPEDLLESELFGHARGAFTGAVKERAGLFEDAHGGTLFLDELSELSPRAQAKLLRVLQQHEVRRVGESFSRKVDVRVVSAANRDIGEEAAQGRFRQDLLYRLDVIRIRIPPLRERPGDIAILAQHIWRTASARTGTQAQLAHGLFAALARYHWPGNVRELQNVMAALAVAAPVRGHVRARLLPAAITGAAQVTFTRLAEARAQFERRAIESALARAAGSRTRAARELGLSRQGLLKMMERLGVAR
jgi:DNA-binding NtrC family response regulator